MNNTIDAFFVLLRAGLWEKDACLSAYEVIDFKNILQLSQEQSVEGVIAAGVEHVKDMKIPQEISLCLVGDSLQLEQRNKQMNEFLGSLVEKMRNNDIYAIVVKGQGIAQCYERPLWRACGDVDFFLSRDNYERSKKMLGPLASSIDDERKDAKHIAYDIDSWEVELHGTLHAGIKRSIDKVIDEAQDVVFHSGTVLRYPGPEDHHPMYRSDPNPV